MLCSLLFKFSSFIFTAVSCSIDKGFLHPQKPFKRFPVFIISHSPPFGSQTPIIIYGKPIINRTMGVQMSIIIFKTAHGANPQIDPLLRIFYLEDGIAIAKMANP